MNSVGDTLRRIVAALDAAEVAHMLVGSFASTHWVDRLGVRDAWDRLSRD